MKPRTRDLLTSLAILAIFLGLLALTVVRVWVFVHFILKFW